MTPLTRDEARALAEAAFESCQYSFDGYYTSGNGTEEIIEGMTTSILNKAREMS